MPPQQLSLNHNEQNLEVGGILTKHEFILLDTSIYYTSSIFWHKKLAIVQIGFSIENDPFYLGLELIYFKNHRISFAYFSTLKCHEKLSSNVNWLYIRFYYWHIDLIGQKFNKASDVSKKKMVSIYCSFSRIVFLKFLLFFFLEMMN